MDKIEIPKLYKQYFVDKNDERENLFERIMKFNNPQYGFYPASFVHITLSLYIKEMTYIYSDKRISVFFKDEIVSRYINLKITYDDNTIISALQAYFSSVSPIAVYSFDILFFSQDLSYRPVRDI